MNKLMTLTSASLLAAGPALAASGPFFSLNNTDFVVTIAFVLFVAVIVYLKVPGLIAGILDQRADAIRKDLDEARSLREEAQSILVSYERKSREVSEHAENIVAHAKTEAAAAADAAKEDLKASIARRLAAAEDQLASAEAAALRDVRDKAVAVAVAAAAEVIAARMNATQGNALIDSAIEDVAKRLN
jgi:F-type H+-transporting ATPase subunit b